MTVRTRSELETAADLIRNETGEGANTATRVGGFCRDLVDSVATAAEGSAPGGAAGGDLGGTYPNPTIAPNAVTLAKMADIATDRLLGRDTAGTGDPEPLTVGGGIEFTGSGGIQRSALTGAITAAAGSNSTFLTDNAVTLAKLAQINADRLLGRDTAGLGNVEVIELGSSLAFNGAGGLVRAALTGDVTAPQDSNSTTIANDAVTNAKAANMAEATIKGRAAGAGTGDPTDLTAAQARAILGTLDVQIFTANGTWELPAGATLVEFLLVGGGGGGGAVSGGVGGGGGGAGAIRRVQLPASFIPTTNDLSITIGAAGAAGGAGGPTTISDSLQFGLSANGGSAGTAGGAGGAAGAGGINDGASGGAGGAATGSVGISSGFAGIPGSGGSGGPGGGGTGYGAGGGGGGDDGADGGGGGAGGYGDGTTGGAKVASTGTFSVGGAGASGLVIITTWRG